MNGCEICANRGTPSYKSPCSECYGFNKYEAIKPRITNGDRIRAMTDEELAEFISCKMVETRLDLHPELLMATRRKKLYDTLYWLKQPVEGNE